MAKVRTTGSFAGKSNKLGYGGPNYHGRRGK